MGTNQHYKDRALKSLEGKWSTAIIATLIYLVITSGLSWSMTVPMGDNLIMSYSTQGIWTTICMPLFWGFSIFFLRLIRNENLDYGRLFDGYKDFLRIFLTKLLENLAICIGFCLLIVPGIILAAGLLMTNFILKDDKEIAYIDALKKSWEMTNGHKGELIWLFLSFIGWIILSALTFGIGILFLHPYMQTALAHYYEDLKAEQGV